MNTVNLLITGVLAAASTSFAAEPSFDITTPVSFGQILALAHSECTFNMGGSGLSGTACLESIGTLGNVTISATANESYAITLFPPAGPSNQISYQPLLTDGSSSTTVTADATGRITLQVGGILSIDSQVPTASVPANFVYTIRIDSI